MSAIRRLRVRRARGDRGVSTVEVVILAPVFLVFVLVAVAYGRVQDARISINGAARDGARAASLSGTAGAASSEAQWAVAGTLAAESVRCTGGSATSVDTGAFRPGGIVRVSVSCTVSLSDLGLSGLPGSARLDTSATSPIETYRGES